MSRSVRGRPRRSVRPGQARRRGELGAPVRRALRGRGSDSTARQGRVNVRRFCSRRVVRTFAAHIAVNVVRDRPRNRLPTFATHTAPDVVRTAARDRLTDLARAVEVRGDKSHTASTGPAPGRSLTPQCPPCASGRPRAHPGAPRAPQNDDEPPRRRLVKKETGGDLLSQALASQVPSALWGLTALFGMGRGVSPTQ
jgi:hypothetical protein